MSCFILKNKLQTGVSLYQIGHEKCSPHHSFGPVERDFFVIHFVVDGEGILEVGNKVYNLKKGDLFLLSINKVIRYHAIEENPYEYYWIGFSGMFNKDILNNIGFNENNYVVHVDDDFDSLLNIFKEIDELSKEDSVKDNMRALSIFYNVISHLVKNDYYYVVDDEKKDMFYKLVNYIDTYEGNVTLAQLEKIANMHRSNIYRSFIQYFKKSPSEYIQDKHLEKALYLLKNTNSSIKKIALSTGFNSTAYFCKCFKNKFNKTPSQARKLK